MNRGEPPTPGPEDEPAGAGDDIGEYCREVEAYLCRKNDGHLIRIVGPSFDRVREWAARGIPLKLVCRGIDRYFERYYAKGPRRRPVKIDFCEADVLDLFDEWRRAVGAAGVSTGEETAAPCAAAQPGHSLPVHVDRVIARLTALRAGAPDRRLDAALDTAVRELDALRDEAKRARGDARQRLVARLADIDATVASAAREALREDEARALGCDAESEIAPFRDRMAADAWQRAVAAALDRLIRERARLPRIAYE